MNAWMACIVAVSLLASVPAWPAPSIQQQQVRFEKGQTGATIKCSLEGSQTVEYQLCASAEHAMVVPFKPNNPSDRFNPLPPGSDEVLLIGSTSGKLARQRQDDNGWSGVNGRELDLTPDAPVHGG